MDLTLPVSLKLLQTKGLVKKLNRKIILIIVLGLTLLMGAGIIFGGLAEYRTIVRSAEGNWIVTDLAQYNQIRKGYEWDNQKLAGHLVTRDSR